MTKSELESLVEGLMILVGMEKDNEGELTIYGGDKYFANTPMRKRLKKLAMKYFAEQEEE